MEKNMVRKEGRKDMNEGMRESMNKWRFMVILRANGYVIESEGKKY